MTPEQKEINELRQKIATAAMQGMLANQYTGGQGYGAQYIAIESVIYADALIEELKKRERK